MNPTLFPAKLILGAIGAIGLASGLYAADVGACGAARQDASLASNVEASAGAGTNAPSDTEKREKTAALEVKGMTCASCGVAVKAALKKVDGYKSATVSQEKERAIVTYDASRTSPQALADAVTRLGYPSRPLEEPTAE